MEAFSIRSTEALSLSLLACPFEGMLFGTSEGRAKREAKEIKEP